MVFTVNLKQLSFKQDISKLKLMLQDQPSTYAILRYAHDIPTTAYAKAMNMLVANGGDITNKKLSRLVKEYSNVSGVAMIMDEEFVESLDIPVGINPVMEDATGQYNIGGMSISMTSE